MRNNSIYMIGVRSPWAPRGGATSLLYFTGSGDFNKNMRTYALENKYTLNEYGIYKLKPDNSKGLKIKTNSEQDIFKILKLDYVEPENRTTFYKF